MLKWQEQTLFNLTVTFKEMPYILHLYYIRTFVSHSVYWQWSYILPIPCNVKYLPSKGSTADLYQSNILLLILHNERTTRRLHKYL